jgi:membrane protease YdiL (CAAX protease family)
MVHALDPVLVLLFVVVWPLLGRFVEYPRLKAAVARGDLEARRRTYRSTIIEQWGLAAAAVALWLWGGRSPASLGLAAPHGWRFVVGLVVGLALIAFLRQQRRAVIARPAVLDRLRGTIDSARALVPHTAREYALWVPLSITAGVCEEILYRGYLTGWLTPALGAIAAPVLATVLFGLAHIYLGRTGAIRAAMAGGLMALFVALTGSLWVSMILHAAIDIHSGRLCFEAVREDRAAGPAEAAPVAKAS